MSKERLTPGQKALKFSFVACRQKRVARFTKRSTWLQGVRIIRQRADDAVELLKHQPNPREIPDLGGGLQGSQHCAQAHTKQIQAGHTEHPCLGREALRQLLDDR